MNIDIPEGFITDDTFARAFTTKKAQLIALISKTPQSPTLDVNNAATVMLTVWENIKPLMPEIEKLDGFVDVALIKELPVRAEALFFTNALHGYAFTAASGLDDGARRLIEERKTLTTEITLAVMRGALPEGAITQSGTIGYQDVAQDVRGMCIILLANWDAVGPAIGGRRERITEVMALADRFVKDIAMGERIKDRLTGPTALRAAAFQLALESYREIDRVVSFLRFYFDDAEKYVPSIYVGGGRPKRRSAKSSEGTKDAETPSQPGTPAAPPAAASGASNVPTNKVTPTGGFGV